MSAKTLMIQGTGSHVGKSILTAGLCRLFAQEGYKVAPFKAQNMALNSYVTHDGKEIARAQVIQAEACNIEPEAEMNPILLKPKADYKSQVIALGKPIDDMSAKQYHRNYRDQAWEIIKNSLDKLKQKYEIIIIEGAGSPAEINLKHHDIVNMKVAEYTGSPVLLVADIDKGGALASIVGTLRLLTPKEKRLIKGLLINKFRGDFDLFKPAIPFLEKETGKKVMGTIPYIHNIDIEEEDSIPKEVTCKSKTDIDIAIIRHPHISNFTDFDQLARENSIGLRYVDSVSKFGSPDVIILPGTKNTVSDLGHLVNGGLADLIIKKAKENTPILGICGGYQMLGQEIIDTKKLESSKGSVKGLCLLPIVTEFIGEEKITTRVKARFIQDSPLFKNMKGQQIEGYEIHIGISKHTNGAKSALVIEERNNKEDKINDGVINHNGLIFGTYIHGLFDNLNFTKAFITSLHNIKGLRTTDKQLINQNASQSKDEAYNRLAEILRKNINIQETFNIMTLGGSNK